MLQTGCELSTRVHTRTHTHRCTHVHHIHAHIDLYKLRTRTQHTRAHTHTHVHTGVHAITCAHSTHMHTVRTCTRVVHTQYAGARTHVHGTHWASRLRVMMCTHPALWPLPQVPVIRTWGHGRGQQAVIHLALCCLPGGTGCPGPLPSREVPQPESCCVSFPCTCFQSPLSLPPGPTR